MPSMKPVNQRRKTSRESAPPRQAGLVDDLPYAVTFFLTAGERREVLHKLRALDADRVTALKKALGVSVHGKGGA